MTREPEEALDQYLLDGSTIDMNVDGSSTPVDYKYTVPAGKSLTLERILFYMDDATAFSPTTFGGISALTNGVDVIIAGSTIVNWKENEDIVCTCFDFVGYPNFGKESSSGAGRWTMRRSFGEPLIVRAGEEVIFRISDNLTGLTHFRAHIQGRLV